jgi:alkylation response protein AidB-like acyl-CoA dehydrogenase
MPESLPTAVAVLRDQMQSLIDEHLRPLEEELPEDTHAAVPAEVTEAVRNHSRQAGMWGMTQPAEFGGIEVGTLALTTVRETLAAANLRLSRYVFGPGPGVLVSAEGQLRETYLEPVMRGEKRGAFAFTEPTGADAPRPTWAARDGDEFVVTGRKAFVTGGGDADFYTTLVNVETGDGPNQPEGTAMIVIDRESPGLTIEREFRSLEGGDHIAMRLEGVRVPSWHVVGKVGEGMPRALRNIGNVRMSVSAQACGIAQWVIGLAEDHITSAHRSGQRLADREGVRLRYAEMRISAFAMRSMLYRTARLVETGGDEAVNEVMATKVFCTEQVGQIVDQAVQLCGGGALIEGHPLERLYREVRSLRFVEGASDILRINIARGRIEFDSGRL